MGRYEYELLQLSQVDALRAAEKQRLLQSIRRTRNYGLIAAFSHAVARVLHELRTLFNGTPNNDVLHITTRIIRHSH
ncbi:MAG: hypothetical protein IPK52_15420 [Chloroflexi bacterium]|nr:hypothetical protein [Chloroflexota bacterium]